MLPPQANDAPAPEKLPAPALILCGGRSRRMGQNKANLKLGTTTVLGMVRQAFERLSEAIYLVTGFASSPPAHHGFDKVIRDQSADLGPMEGIRTGLAAIRQHQPQVDHVLIGTCDAPLVVPGFYRMLHQRAVVCDADIVLPRLDQHWYPLTAVYRMTALPLIEKMVQQRQLRVKDLLGKLRIEPVLKDELAEADPGLETVLNINTPKDYALIQKHFTSKPG